MGKKKFAQTRKFNEGESFMKRYGMTFSVVVGFTLLMGILGCWGERTVVVPGPATEKTVVVPGPVTEKTVFVPAPVKVEKTVIVVPKPSTPTPAPKSPVEIKVNLGD